MMTVVLYTVRSGVPEPPVRGKEGLAQKGEVLVLLAPVSHRSLHSPGESLLLRKSHLSYSLYVIHACRE